MYHEPVFLHESLDMLRIQPDGAYVDVTFGGGGHSEHVLRKLSDKGRLYAFDQDEDARANADREPFKSHPGFVFVASNFRHLKRQLRAEGLRAGSIDGILADLGVSSWQLDTPDRGFSYRFDAELDMRMDKDGDLRADEVLNTYNYAQLKRVFGELGEVRNTISLANACMDARGKKPFRTTGDLVALCESVMIGDRWRYLSQVFQALRMEVNDETGALADFLKDAGEMLRPGGRLVVIAYHSIEDRIVKNFLKTGNADGTLVQDFYGNIERPFDIVTKKALQPSEAEIQQNPRARSAKLRVGEKK